MKFPDSIKQNFAAFLAAFSTKPEPDQALEADENLDNLYASFCASFPETFSLDAAKTQLEKEFLSEINFIQLSVSLLKSAPLRVLTQTT